MPLRVRRPTIMNPQTGESGKWQNVQGRHIFVPTAERDPKEIGDVEVERWEHPTPSFKDEKQIYIKEEQNKKHMNKSPEISVGDQIHYYNNGKESKGTVVTLYNDYVKILKSDGTYDTINQLDVFHVDEIIIKSKTWDAMDYNEKAEVLNKIHAPLHFITRDWRDLPKEIKSVLKSNTETSRYGNVGYEPNVLIDTNMDIEAPEDYEETRSIKEMMAGRIGTDEARLPEKADSSPSMISGLSDKVKDDKEVKKEGLTTSTSGVYNPTHKEKDQE